MLLVVFKTVLMGKRNEPWVAGWVHGLWVLDGFGMFGHFYAVSYGGFIVLVWDMLGF